MIGTFFKLVGKAMRMAINRPIQRFNIFNRVKKHLGEDAKYFMPAPRAIGPQSLRAGKPEQYPHLQGSFGFKSIEQRRQEAIAERNNKLLAGANINEGAKTIMTSQDSDKASRPSLEERKSFSETINDDNLVISASAKLPVIKTVTQIGPSISDDAQEVDPKEEGEAPISSSGELVAQDKPKRPLPTSTNLQLSDPAVIWQVDKVPPGRLDLSKLQELMINKLADDAYWTPKQIAETYNIKEAYAENLITYFKQIRIIISPRMATALDYVARNDPAYQATKHIIYHVDKSLRSEFDKQFDKTFLPTDELDPKVRELLDADSSPTPYKQPHSRLANLIKRPEPLRLGGSSSSLNQDNNSLSQLDTKTDESKQDLGKKKRFKKRLAIPLNVRQEASEDSKEEKSEKTN